jgi:predicted MPP superfamily phosphohydrolase
MRQTPRRHSRVRLATFRAVERIAAWCGGRRLYRSLHLSKGRFAERDERLLVPGLPLGLRGFTIAHLSDLHGGPFLKAGDLAAVVDAINARAPDLCVITGDLITHHWSESLPPLEDCARLEAAHGVLGVFGNHDYKDRLEGKIAESYALRGIRFLRNECARIDTGSGTLAVVGVEDLEEARVVDVEKARAGVREGDVEIVLCHNPAGAATLAREGCAAILSGHTHGTQIDLPFLRRLGPKHPGLRVRLGATTLIVSRGLGVVGIPLRLFARAEVVYVRLEASA